MQEFHKREPHARALFLDGSIPQAAMEVALGDTSSCSVLVLAAFVNVAAYRGNVALTGDLVPFAAKAHGGPGSCGLCGDGQSLPALTAAESRGQRGHVQHHFAV